MATCEHRMVGVMWSDPKIDPRQYALKGQEIFRGRLCVECGHFEPRKPGEPWEICYMCEGDMSNGKRKNVLIVVHQCKDKECGHRYNKRDYDLSALEISRASKMALVPA